MSQPVVNPVANPPSIPADTSLPPMAFPSADLASGWVQRYIDQGFKPVHWELTSRALSSRSGYKGPRGKGWTTNDFFPLPKEVTGIYQVGMKMGTPCVRAALPATGETNPAGTLQKRVELSRKALEEEAMGPLPEARLVAAAINPQGSSDREIVPGMGGVFGYLVCVDIEDKNDVVMQLADTYLPPTKMVGGRADKPRSHRFYITTAPMNSFSWKGARTDGKGEPGEETTLLEIIGVAADGSVGKQVVVAPSVHLDAGVNYVWESYLDSAETPGGAAVLSCEVLFEACRQLMAAAGQSSLAVGRNRPPAWTEKSSARSSKSNQGYLETAGLFNIDQSGGQGGYGPSEEVQKTRGLSDQETTTLLENVKRQISELKDGEHNTGLNLHVYNAASFLAGGGRGEEDFQRLSDVSLEACELGPEGTDLRKCSDTIDRAIRDGRSKPRIRAGLRKYALTAQGLADLLSDEWRDHYRWVWEWNQWIRFTGHVWAPVPCEEHVLRVMVVPLRWAQFEASRIAQTQKDPWGEAAFKWYFQCENLEAGSKALRLLRDELGTGKGLGISSSELDSDPLLFACQNGVFNFNTGTLQDFCRSDMITRQAAFRYVPGSSCPRWDAQMKWAFEPLEDREEMERYVRRWFGYAATGYTKEQAIMIAAGDGANGKSTIINTLVSVLGEGQYGTHASPYVLISMKNQTKNQDELLALENTRLAMVSEPEQGQFFTEGLLKRLTEPSIKFQAKYASERTMRMTACLILDTNHVPRVQGADWGIFRRLKIVPFVNRIEDHERDTLLSSKLLKEGDGILTQLLDEGYRYCREGLLPEPESMEAAFDSYKRQIDPVHPFLSDYCLFLNEVQRDFFAALKRADKDPSKKNMEVFKRLAFDLGLGASATVAEFKTAKGLDRLSKVTSSYWVVGASQLYDSYATYARNSGNFPKNRNNFGNLLRKACGDLGVEARRTRAGVVYVGLRLKEHEDPVNVFLREGGEKEEMVSEKRGVDSVFS